MEPGKKIGSSSAIATLDSTSYASSAVVTKPHGKGAVSSPTSMAPVEVPLMLLRDVSLGPHEAALRFRLIHFWEAINPRTKKLIGQEVLLIDEEVGFLNSTSARTSDKEPILSVMCSERKKGLRPSAMSRAHFLDVLNNSPDGTKASMRPSFYPSSDVMDLESYKRLQNSQPAYRMLGNITVGNCVKHHSYQVTLMFQDGTKELEHATNDDALFQQIKSAFEEGKNLAKSLDFVIDTTSGNHPFDPYTSLLKIAGTYVLVGFPSEIKIQPATLNLGMRMLAGSVTGGNSRDGRFLCSS